MPWNVETATRLTVQERTLEADIEEDVQETLGAGGRGFETWAKEKLGEKLEQCKRWQCEEQSFAT